MNKTTHIDFGVKGKLLQMKNISDMLGIEATSGFNPNEPYIGKAKKGNAIVTVQRNRPSFGVWHFSTEGKVNSNDVEDHSRYLLETLGGAKEQIQELLQSPLYEVLLSIWYNGPCGFRLSSFALSQLANTCEYLDVRCFETDQESLSDTAG